MNNFANQAVGSYQSIQQVLLSAADSLLSAIAAFLPNLVGALLVLVLGYFVAKTLRSVTVTALKFTGFTKLVESMEFNKHLMRVGFEKTVSQLIASFVYWVVLITFLIGVFETLGLSVAVRTLESLVAYLPNVIIAAITIVLTLIVGRFAHRVIDAGLAQFDISFGGVAATVAEMSVILFGAVIAASQLGLDTTIITANVSVIVAGVMAILVLSIGLGGRTVVANVLGSYYAKQVFKVGSTVSLAGHHGTVKNVSAVAVTLSTSNGDVMIPNDVVMKNGSLTKV